MRKGELHKATRFAFLFTNVLLFVCRSEAADQKPQRCIADNSHSLVYNGGYATARVARTTVAAKQNGVYQLHLPWFKQHMNSPEISNRAAPKCPIECEIMVYDRDLSLSYDRYTTTVLKSLGHNVSSRRSQPSSVNSSCRLTQPYDERTSLLL